MGTREGRSADKQKGESANRPQTARGRSRDRNTSSVGNTRAISKSPSRQLLQQALNGARTQKQRSSSSPRSQPPNSSPKTQQNGYKEPADADDLKQLNKTSIGGGSAGKRSEEQSQLFSPSAAQLQELLQFAVESAANDKTKPEGKSVLQTDAQLSGSTAKGCSNEERADKRGCPLPVVTTVVIEETKETKCSSRSVSTENLDIPGSPATRRATSKETKTSSKETTTLTKSTTRSTENLHTLGSLGSPNSLLVDFQTKCPEEKVAFGGGAASRQVTEN